MVHQQGDFVMLRLYATFWNLLKKEESPAWWYLIPSCIFNKSTAWALISVFFSPLFCWYPLPVSQPQSCSGSHSFHRATCQQSTAKITDKRFSVSQQVYTTIHPEIRLTSPQSEHTLRESLWQYPRNRAQHTQRTSFNTTLTHNGGHDSSFNWYCDICIDTVARRPRTWETGGTRVDKTLLQYSSWWKRLRKPGFSK